MDLSKYLSTTIAVILTMFITYNSVVTLNNVEASTNNQILVRAFTIFSIIYTCGKLTPVIALKAMSTITRMVKFIVKNQSDTKP